MLKVSKILQAASGDFWASPEGEVVSVNSQAHARVAEDILKRSLGYSPNLLDTVDELLKLGWVRGSQNTLLAFSWGQQQLEVAQKAVANRSQKLYVEQVSGSQWVALQADEFCALNTPNKLFKAMRYSKTSGVFKVAYVPHTLTSFKSNETNSVACDLFASFYPRFEIGRAIALTRSELAKQGLDLTPMGPLRPLEVAAPVVVKKKKLDEYPSLFSNEDLKYS